MLSWLDGAFQTVLNMSIAAAVIGLITFALALIISERWHMMQ